MKITGKIFENNCDNNRNYYANGVIKKIIDAHTDNRNPLLYGIFGHDTHSEIHLSEVSHIITKLGEKKKKLPRKLKKKIKGDTKTYDLYLSRKQQIYCDLTIIDTKNGNKLKNILRTNKKRKKKFDDIFKIVPCGNVIRDENGTITHMDVFSFNIVTKL